MGTYRLQLQRSLQARQNAASARHAPTTGHTAIDGEEAEVVAQALGRTRRGWSR